MRRRFDGDEGAAALAASHSLRIRGTSRTCRREHLDAWMRDVVARRMARSSAPCARVSAATTTPPRGGGGCCVEASGADARSSSTGGRTATRRRLRRRRRTRTGFYEFTTSCARRPLRQPADAACRAPSRLARQDTAGCSRRGAATCGALRRPQCLRRRRRRGADCNFGDCSPTARERADAVSTRADGDRDFDEPRPAAPTPAWRPDRRLRAPRSSSRVASADQKALEIMIDGPAAPMALVRERRAEPSSPPRLSRFAAGARRRPGRNGDDARAA